MSDVAELWREAVGLVALQAPPVVQPVRRAGLPGLVGPAGPRGLPGKDGRDGANGRDGKDGARGPQGLQGKSAMALLPARVEFQRNEVTGLTERVLLQARSGGPIVEIVPERVGGYMTGASVNLYE